MEGVAAREAAQREPEAAERSVTSKRLFCVEGAGRMKAADVSKEGGKHKTVEMQERATECRETGRRETI
jgi:hypothetical protein